MPCDTWKKVFIEADRAFFRDRAELQKLVHTVYPIVQQKTAEACNKNAAEILFYSTDGSFDASAREEDNWTLAVHKEPSAESASFKDRWGFNQPLMMTIFITADFESLRHPEIKNAATFAYGMLDSIRLAAGQYPSCQSFYSPPKPMIVDKLSRKMANWYPGLNPLELRNFGFDALEISAAQSRYVAKLVADGKADMEKLISTEGRCDAPEVRAARDNLAAFVRNSL